MLTLCNQGLAATAAGTVLTNVAKVTYEDAAGNSYEAESNEALVTVAQVYSASLSQDDLAATGAAGQTVYMTHTLRNDGNGTDTYHLSVDQLAGTDSIDFTAIAVYQDGGINGVGANGQVDGAETLLADLSGEQATITLGPGEFVELVVALSVPTSAGSADTAEYTLTTEAEQGTGGAVSLSVDDLTTGNGLDTTEGTNQGRVTVTGDAVLNLTKSATHDTANNRITYTLTVTNTGNAPARDVVLFDGLPQGTTLVAGSVSAAGLINTGDVVNPTSVALRESTLGYDLNGDGDVTDDDEVALGIDLNTNGNATDGSVAGIYAVDAELPANTTVRLSFTVSFDPAALGAGSLIDNAAHIAGDVDGDADYTEIGETKTSNTVSIVVPGDYAVSADDTGTGAVNGMNDGGDDDGALNDVQSVDSVPQGATVLFDNVITNGGNASDTYELAVLNDGGAAWIAAGGTMPSVLYVGSAQCDGTAASQFPAGTVFSITDSVGNPLTNTNASGGVDTGPLNAGGTLDIVVRAILPAGVSGVGEYCATLQVKSAGDSSVVDYKVERLGTITGAVADIANSDTALPGPGVDTDSATLGGTTAIATRTGGAGQTVIFPIYVENDSGIADSFNLSAGSWWDGSSQGPMPAGWTVVFKDASGNIVTNTGLLPPGETVQFTAHATIPAGITQTAADYTGADVNNDGTAETVDGNGDGDGDYPIYFRIASATGKGTGDVVLDAVDVNPIESVVVSPSGADTVSPGGTVDYSQSVANNGNTTENVTLSTSHTNTHMTVTLLIDTTGDGVPDTDWGSLAIGNTVYVTDASGATVARVLVDEGGSPAVPLAPGDEMPIEAQVFATTAVGAGDTDTLTVTAIYDVSGVSMTSVATDLTTVVLGQVDPVKSAAADLACDGTPDGAFAANLTTRVPPGGCVIWQILATNRGTDDALDVVIHDAAPAYTVLVAGSLQSCTGNGCAPAVTGNKSDDGTNVTFNVGVGATAAQGGTLAAGASATARFSTRVE